MRMRINVKVKRLLRQSKSRSFGKRETKLSPAAKVSGPLKQVKPNKQSMVSLHHSSLSVSEGFQLSYQLKKKTTTPTSHYFLSEGKQTTRRVEETRTQVAVLANQSLTFTCKPPSTYFIILVVGAVCFVSCPAKHQQRGSRF